ncbi:MAG: methyltransferase domain-containing protein [Dehalococcoidia bacterium]
MELDAATALRPTEADALTAWAALVDADAEQVPRVREPEPPADHYAGTAARFRPGHLEALELPVLESFAEPDDTWLDIGAGGGRFAVPLAARVARVVAVEPSESMQLTLAAAAADAGRENIELHDVRWPDAGWTQDADVSLAAHALYDIREVGAFLDAMERHTRRLCIAVFGQQARGATLRPLFEAVHGEPLHTLPALREFVALLGARGRRAEVRTVGGGETTVLAPHEDAYAEARRLLWLAPDSEKDRRMRALMDEWWGTPAGIRMPAARPFIGIVSWTPPR